MTSIYVGANKVVHFTAPDDSGFGFSSLDQKQLPGSGSCLSSSLDCECSQPKSSGTSSSSSSSCSSCLSSNLNQPDSYLGFPDCGCSQPKSSGTSSSSSSSCSSCLSSNLNQPASYLGFPDCGCSQPKSSGTSSSSRSSCSCCLSSNLNQPASCLGFPDCGYQQHGSGVILSCLNCFVGTGSLYLYQYGVNTFVYVSKLRGGTCTVAKSDPPQDAIHRAMYLLQNSIFGDYHVVRNNCEDFALYCKTGLLVRCNPTTGSSGQVNFLSNVSWKFIIYSTAEKVVRTTFPFVTVALEIGAHSWKKYKTDIGVRDDVEKVKVEEVASFRGVNRGR